jgi:hypothetical protein
MKTEVDTSRDTAAEPIGNLFLKRDRATGQMLFPAWEIDRKTPWTGILATRRRRLQYNRQAMQLLYKEATL